ncbi:hypothetical protein ACTQ7D_002351 [Vibrio fluvialis]
MKNIQVMDFYAYFVVICWFLTTSLCVWLGGGFLRKMAKKPLKKNAGFIQPALVGM